MDRESKYYNVVLKACSRREKLGRRLETVLLRGHLAIKMALDKMPSVIIYKGKVDNIIPVMAAFTAENAAITITTGELPPALPITSLYPEWLTLPKKLMHLLTNVPNNLWLGEAIYNITPANFLDEDGALVITDQTVYFIDHPVGDTDCRWLAVPCSHITGCGCQTGIGGLEIIYRDTTGSQTDVFLIPAEYITAAEQALQRALANKSYCIKIKTSCPACGHITQANLENATTASNCSCGQRFERTIIN